MSEKIFSKEIVYFLAAIWAVFAIDFLLVGMTFNGLGIRPRSMDGLIGVVLSPFLHGGLGHILANSISFVGCALLVRIAAGTKILRLVMLFGAIGGGIGAWLFSTGGIVVGASGMIYALIGFLFAQALFTPSIRSWAGALLTLIFFGGALLSFFSFSPFISWAGHFWGFVAGIGTAYAFKKLNVHEKLTS